MPSTGRLRKPTIIKELQGTLQPCRINPFEPKVEVGEPEVPNDLSPEASKIWDAIVPVLMKIGTLARTDGMALEGLCNAWADVNHARRELARYNGRLTYDVIATSGAISHRPYPEVGMINDADRRLMAWLGRFGLTPSDRSRVSAHIDDEVNPFDELGDASAGQEDAAD